MRAQKRNSHQIFKNAFPYLTFGVLTLMTLILLMVFRAGGGKRNKGELENEMIIISLFFHARNRPLSSPEPETDLLFSGVSFIIGIYPSEISGNGFSISELVHGTLSREGLDLF